MGAARAGRHNRRALRYPRNADIEEAADDEPEKENRGNDHHLTVTQDRQGLNGGGGPGCSMANRRGPRPGGFGDS